MSITIALAGNPNSGKTTLFNALTGASQYVGNWPGVTVEKKEGKLKAVYAGNEADVTVTDLPGIYSLSPYTLEEVVARNYLIRERPDVILNIVDGTNMERNLYLSTQLMELGIPVVMAVNMMDVVEKNGGRIYVDKLSQLLGCEVVEISALKGTGIDRAAAKAVVAAEKAVAAAVHGFSERVEAAVHRVEERLGSEIDAGRRRFFAIKLLERDDRIAEHLHSVPDAASEIAALEEAFDDDMESIFTNERYTFLSSVVDECCTKGDREKLTASDRIDKIVTNRFLALPVFVAIMFIVYYISVTSVGALVTDWTNDGLFGDGWYLAHHGIWVPGIPVLVTDGLEAMGCAGWLQGLIVDGIIGGVGAVLGFVPQMLVLFIFLAFLEGSGYMARAAFIMDRIFRRFGLSGKSFIPMLIGTGCGVPGIMASRTIENERDRRMTIMTTTFIPCGAKLPIVALLASALFGGAWWVAPSAYFLGIAAIVLSGIILKKTRMFAGDPAPFIMELPAYHLPAAGSVLRSMWERGWSFIKRAGTVILVSAILIWAGSVFGVTDGSFGFHPDIELENSVLGYIGRGLQWLFVPLGFGNIKAVTATIMGLAAKEEVVAVFGVLDFEGMSRLAGYSFLAFNLLCAPCFAAMGAIRGEMNSGRWTAFAIAYQCVFAYGTALIIYQTGMLLSGAFTIWTVAALLLAVILLYLIFRPYRESPAPKWTGKTGMAGQS